MSSMDHPDSPGGGPLPRKQLQGPRPTPLKVRKESHKIKKPPAGPSHNQHPPPQPPPQPVVIYTVSPKVIHTHPSEFMTLVQRLTGPDATSSQQHNNNPSSFGITTSSSSSNSTSMVGGYSSSSIVTNHNHINTAHHHVSGAISPAARLASIEKTKMHSDVKKFVVPKYQGKEKEINIIDLDQSISGGAGDSDGDGGNNNDREGAEKTVVFPGILSPGPGSLPPISPNFFSQIFQHDPNNLISLQQQHGNKSLIEGSHLPSPFSTNLFTPSPMFSPSSLDFLQRVWDN